MLSGTLIAYEFKSKSGSRRTYYKITATFTAYDASVGEQDPATLIVSVPINITRTARTTTTATSGHTMRNTFIGLGGQMSPSSAEWRLLSDIGTLDLSATVDFSQVVQFEVTKALTPSEGHLNAIVHYSPYQTKNTNSTSFSLGSINIPGYGAYVRTQTRITLYANHPVDDTVVVYPDGVDQQHRLFPTIDEELSGIGKAVDTSGTYKFTGWYRDAACTDRVEFPILNMPSTLQKWYAGWELRTNVIVKTKIDGAWLDGELKMKSNGEWVDVDDAYVKVNGLWVPIS